jgi:hypothetical protein
MFYGLKKLVYVLATPTYSTVSHIRDLQVNAVKMLKAQAKIIEMTWRAAMLVSLTTLVKGNGEYTCPRWGSSKANLKKTHYWVNFNTLYRGFKLDPSTAYGHDGGCHHWLTKRPLAETDFLKEKWDDMTDDVKNALAHYPLEYLYKTYNTSQSVSVSRNFSVFPRSTWNAFKKNSEKIIEYEITRFGGGFHAAPQPGIETPSAAAKIYWDDKWGELVKEGGVFFRTWSCHWGTYTGTPNFGTYPHMRGGLRCVTEQNDPRSLCDIPWNEHWLESAQTRALFGPQWYGAGGVPWMMQKIAEPTTKNDKTLSGADRESAGRCADCPRLVEMLYRPPWRRDGWVKNPSASRMGQRYTPSEAGYLF